MAIVTFCFTAKQLVSTFRGSGVKVDTWFWRRSWNRKLVEVKLRQLLCDPIFFRWNVRQIRKTVRCSDRKLRRIVQSWIEEPADTMHFQSCDKRVPITYGPPGA